LAFGDAWRTDLVAQRPDAGRQIAVQVKTKSTGGDWRMGGVVDASEPTLDEWFAFVDLFVDPDRRPGMYLVPRDHVRALGIAQRSLDSRMGGHIVSESDIHGYRDAWGLLEQRARDVKSEFDSWVHDHCDDRPSLEALNL
jgi:hypothetical protein